MRIQDYSSICFIIQTVVKNVKRSRCKTSYKNDTSTRKNSKKKGEFCKKHTLQRSKREEGLFCNRLH